MNEHECNADQDVPIVTLKVVLLCKGRGADASSYRPNRDESQWWCRRDALVRCVAAFLYGPSSTFHTVTGDDSSSSGGGKRELVLLFDDDLARIHMSLVSDDESSKNNVKKNMSDETRRMVPTEQALVSLWKQAAQKPNETITYHGLACTIHVNRFDEDFNDTTAISAESSKKVRASTTTTTTTTTTTMPRGLDSKRQVLEYLQQQCSIEFLRQHGLNSKPDIILRKANKSSLMKVWNQWRQEMNKSMSQQPQTQTPQSSFNDAASTENTNRQQRKTRMEAIYTELLRPPLPFPKTESLSSQPTIHSIEVVAGTLHEDFEELPCYGNENDLDGSRVNHNHNHNGTSHRCRRKQLHVCLFLGAVRDMYPMEYEALQGACHRLRIPVVGIRLGTVPEFTSKILSILTFHHAQGRLGTAVLRLAKSNTAAKIVAAAAASSEKVSATPTLPPSCLHVIAMVPLSSDQLSTDLKHRNRIHWSLVRLVVCTLWRSKLASSTSASAHTNTLTLVFDNGVVVTLGETEFVHALAEQHQAAPCEFQILASLYQKVRKTTATETLSKKKQALQIIRNVTSTSPLPVTCLLCIESDGDETTTTTSSSSSPSSSTRRNDSDRLVQNFYSSNASSSTATTIRPTTTATATPDFHPHHCVIALLAIDTGNATAEDEASERNHKTVKAVIKAATRMDLPVMRHLQLVRSESSQDWEAATVVALQHFCYQNRMFPAVSHARVANEEEEDEVCAAQRTSSSSSMKTAKSKKRKHDIK